MIWWDVAKKEILANITTPKVLITYLVCTLLILAAMITGAHTYLALKDEALKQRAAEEERLQYIFNFQQDYLQQGVYIYREPSVLSVLVSGVEGDSARRAQMTNYTDPTYDVSKFNSSPVLAIFGLLDLAFIVKLILSLFAILFTFDAISGEREMGTLKLNLSNDVKRSSFIVGKLVGNFVLLFIPFIIPVLLGLLYINFLGGITFTGEDWARTGLIMLAFVLYLIVFYSLGVMVSAMTKHSAVSFLVLLMAYVLFIAIIPRVSVLVAQALEPVPSIDELRKEVIMSYGPLNRRAYEVIGSRAQEFQRQVMQRQPRRPPISSPEAEARYQQEMKEFQSWVQQKQTEFNAFVAEETSKAYEEFRLMSQKKAHEQSLKQDAQNKLAVTLSRFTSPAASLTFISDRLAKTGVYSSDEVFKRKVEKSQEAFVSANNAILKENPDYISFGQGQTEAIDMSEYYPNIDRTPDERFDESLSAVMFDYLFMVLLIAVFFTGSFLAFNRYDVR